MEKYNDDLEKMFIAIKQTMTTTTTQLWDAWDDEDDNLSFYVDKNSGVEPLTTLFGSYQGYIDFMQWLNPNVENVEWIITPQH